MGSLENEVQGEIDLNDDRFKLQPKDLYPIYGFFRYNFRTPLGRTDEMPILPRVMILGVYHSSYLMSALAILNKIQ